MQAKIKNRRLAIIRTDASSQIGMGHLMRCFGLAEALRARNFKVVFAVKNHLDYLSEKIRKNGYKVEFIPRGFNNRQDADLLVNYIAKYRPSIVITDSYSIDNPYLKRIKDAGCILVSLSRLSRNDLYSDLIINYSLGISRQDYSKKAKPGARLLLGPKYFLLRKEFLNVIRRKKIKKNRRIKLLVSLGGSDASKIVLKILKGLSVFRDKICLNVVIGPAYKLASRIKTIARKEFTGSKIYTNPPRISKLMSEADLAITGAGITCYELAYLGVPNIIMAIAGNQKSNLENFTKKRLAIGLGEACRVNKADIREAAGRLIRSKRLRDLISIKGRGLVNGKGAEMVSRVIERIHNNGHEDKGR
jgi:UDP-2,4-diacetamido-2,4,6-trideoxy-beta-L-altropyranose hydrolase